MPEPPASIGLAGAIGVYGGTFDPVHVGHVQVAAEVRGSLGLAHVTFVPAHQSPLKGRPSAPITDRLEMVRLAVGGLSWASVSEVEAERPPPSFTVETMRALANRFPSERLALIIGADALVEFADWREPGAILGIATVIAITRVGVPLVISPRMRALAELHPGRLVLHRASVSAVASRDIRARVSRGESIDGLVPVAVAEFVESMKLYRDG